MFSKDVKYTDFNGKEQTEKLHFHMMVPEFADLEFNPTFQGATLSEWVRDGMTSGNMVKIYTIFKLLIVNSYGRRSEDGATFMKREVWTDQFLNSMAYEEFFVWLVRDPKNAEKFWKAIVPEKINELIPDNAINGKKELHEMSHQELLELYKKKEEELSRKALESGN